MVLIHGVAHHLSYKVLYRYLDVPHLALYPSLPLASPGPAPHPAPQRCTACCSTTECPPPRCRPPPGPAWCWVWRRGSWASRRGYRTGWCRWGVGPWGRGRGAGSGTEGHGLRSCQGLQIARLRYRTGCSRRQAFAQEAPAGLVCGCRAARRRGPKHCLGAEGWLHGCRCSDNASVLCYCLRCRGLILALPCQ